jgi:hypothetical protein
MNNLTQRLEKLEKNVTDQSIQASTADGQNIRLRRDNLLPLVTAAMRRRYAEIEDLPMPASRFDDRLDLIKRSGVISPEPMLNLASDVLRTAGQLNE